MRILLDAKDLINVVEHSNPIPILEFGAWLRERSALLVYSLGNIRGLAAPIALDASELPRILGYIDQLDSLPHCFIGPEIDVLELERALECFEADKEYEPVDPYIPRFDFVFSPSTRFDRLNYPMREIVHDLWRACPHIFRPHPKFRQAQGFAMSIDRAEAVARRLPPKPSFDWIVDVVMLKRPVKHERAKELAAWISASASRCPGMWLSRAIGFAMSQNTGYAARRDDTFDMAEMWATPYVDAATVDRCMLDWFTRAVRGLQENAKSAVPKAKVFKSLPDLMTSASSVADGEKPGDI